MAGAAVAALPTSRISSWPGWVGDELVAALDLEGVSVSSGAACSAGTVEPSPVLQAMLGDEDATRGVRMSIGDTTTDDDIDLAIRAFQTVLGRAGLGAAHTDTQAGFRVQE